MGYVGLSQSSSESKIASIASPTLTDERVDFISHLTSFYPQSTALFRRLNKSRKNTAGTFGTRFDDENMVGQIKTVITQQTKTLTAKKKKRGEINEPIRLRGSFSFSSRDCSVSSFKRRGKRHELSGSPSTNQSPRPSHQTLWETNIISPTAFDNGNACLHPLP